MKRVELGAILSTDLDQVAEAFVCHEGRWGHLSSEHRVQADCGAVYELDPWSPIEDAEAVEHSH